LIGRESFYVALAGPPPAPPSIIEWFPLRKPSSSRFVRVVISTLQVVSLMWKTNFDLYHLHDPETLPAALFSRLFMRKRFVWDAHEDYVEQLKSSREKRRWIPNHLVPIASLLMRGVLKLSDNYSEGISAATPGIAKKYSNLNTMVIGNEARLEDFQDSFPTNGTKAFLFIGNPSSPLTLFKEIVSVISNLPDTRLGLAWREPSIEILRMARDQLGDRFVFLGFLGRQELCKTINEYSFGFVTYTNLHEESYSQSTKFIEFAAAGLPVICTPNESLKYMINKSRNAILAHGFDVESLSRAIEESLSLPEEQWKNLSENGRRWARNESNWDISEIKLLALYNNITL
jgi:glycosyltransferase involved in cell wall biosynthesis